MRIIAGKYGGRRLAAVPGEVRPSSDRLRESLFNVLGPSIEGSVWLDLFAGSGAVGIEALSRGARHVILNDRSSQAARLIRKNLALCQVKEGYELHEVDAFVFLKKFKSPAPDFIFLDPPYDFGRHEKLLRTLTDLPLLQPQGLIILEIFKKQKLELPRTLVLSRLLQVGDSRLFFLRPAQCETQQDAEQNGGNTQDP